MDTVRDQQFLDSITFATNGVTRFFVKIILGSSKSFFAYLPRIAGGDPRCIKSSSLFYLMHTCTARGKVIGLGVDMYICIY